MTCKGLEGELELGRLDYTRRVWPIAICAKLKICAFPLVGARGFARSHLIAPKQLDNSRKNFIIVSNSIAPIEGRMNYSVRIQNETFWSLGL